RMLGELATLSPRAPRVPFYSTVTGALLDSAPLDSEYWYRNLRETVRFEQAVRAVAERATILIEASPHPVLTVSAERAGGARRVGGGGGGGRRGGGEG